jgi:hypothetical protein
MTATYIYGYITIALLIIILLTLTTLLNVIFRRRELANINSRTPSMQDSIWEPIQFFQPFRVSSDIELTTITGIAPAQMDTNGE